MRLTFFVASAALLLGGCTTSGTKDAHVRIGPVSVKTP
jgi:hypothetical protein